MVSSKAVDGKCVQFKDASGKPRYGHVLRVRSDWVTLAEMPRWWSPGKTRHVPRSYVAVWGVPFGDILATVNPNLTSSQTQEASA